MKAFVLRSKQNKGRRKKSRLQPTTLIKTIKTKNPRVIYADQWHQGEWPVDDIWKMIRNGSD